MCPAIAARLPPSGSQRHVVAACRCQACGASTQHSLRGLMARVALPSCPALTTPLDMLVSPYLVFLCATGTRGCDHMMQATRLTCGCGLLPGDEPVFAVDEVHTVGQLIAIVVADTEHQVGVWWLAGGRCPVLQQSAHWLLSAHSSQCCDGVCAARQTQHRSSSLLSLRSWCRHVLPLSRSRWTMRTCLPSWVSTRPSRLAASSR